MNRPLSRHSTKRSCVSSDLMELARTLLIMVGFGVSAVRLTLGFPFLAAAAAIPTQPRRIRPSWHHRARHVAIILLLIGVALCAFSGIRWSLLIGLPILLAAIALVLHDSNRPYWK
jgi:formate-dependent nitrite reductase membrane component NrfD